MARLPHHKVRKSSRASYRVGAKDDGYTEFHGMDRDVMLKSLNVLVRRNKAQVFGSEDEKGVKFF
jgi:hypothetical protein